MVVGKEKRRTREEKVKNENKAQSRGQRKDKKERDGKRVWHAACHREEEDERARVQNHNPVVVVSFREDFFVKLLSS